MLKIDSKIINDVNINVCGIIECPPDWVWDTVPEGLKDYDIWFANQGDGKFKQDGHATIPLFPGTCLLLPPFQHFMGTQNPGSIIWEIYVHFDFIGSDGKPYYPLPPEIINKYISDNAFFKAALQKVVRLFNSNQKDKANLIFKAALVEFFEQESSFDVKAQKRDKYRIVQSICDAVNANLSNVPSMTELSEQYGYSTDYLGRLFSSQTGMSLAEYTTNARINAAKHLLVSSAEPIQDISSKLGYWDICYFSKTFKKMTGLAPGEYRKKSRDKAPFEN